MLDDEPAEQLDLADLPSLWARLEDTYRRVKTLPPSSSMSELTARRFDEAQVAGTRTWIAADRYLLHAMEHHHALLSLLEHHGATPTAPWSLLRPMYESSFFALWVLDTDDGKARRIRGLRCEARDLREGTSYIREFQGIPDLFTAVEETIQRRRAKAENTYKTEASQLGITWDRLTQRVTVIDEVKKLRGLQADPVLRATVAAHWRLLSGYEHGLAWSLMAGSDKTVRSSIPGGSEMTMTINDQAFVTAYKTCLWLAFTALDRYMLLHTEPN